MPEEETTRKAGRLAAVVIAACAGSGFAQAQSADDAAGRERCYGVAEAGENDGIDGREAPGTSTVDYQGNAWVWVEAGTCLRMALPVQPDGSPRRGSIEPIARDRP